VTDRFVPATVLVTGGAGFIGSNLVRVLLRERPALRVVVLDLLTYAANLESLADVEAAHGAGGDGRYRFVRGDVRDGALVADLLAGAARDARGGAVPRPDAVLHLAAESHVDRSILDAAPFVSTNVHGTVTLLEAVRAELARAPRPFRFVNVGTDEVYGALDAAQPPVDEEAPLRPNSPYAASKAAADCFVRAYAHTHRVPAILTRCTNNYGPCQFPEKLIPLMIVRALRDEPLPVFGDGLHVRDWIHVEDHAAALLAVLEQGRPGATYNIGAGAERPNLALVRAVLGALGRPESLVRFVPDRPGHDRRYALDATKLRRETGWAPRRAFDEGLRATVDWYVAHRGWWERVLSEAYRATNELYLGASAERREGGEA
jgi:dTDP-glucose 4,6-dehydratase